MFTKEELLVIEDALKIADEKYIKLLDESKNNKKRKRPNETSNQNNKNKPNNKFKNNKNNNSKPINNKNEINEKLKQVLLEKLIEKLK